MRIFGNEPECQNNLLSTTQGSMFKLFALHPAPDRAASRSSILNVAFFGAMTQLRGTPLTQRHLFWLEEFLFSSEALNFRVPLS